MYPFWFVLLCAFSAVPSGPYGTANTGVRLDTDTANGPGVASSCRPKVVGDTANTLHFVWRDYRGSKWQVGYRRGANFGASMAASDVMISSTTGSAFDPEVASVTKPAGSVHVYVTWRTLISPGIERIYFARSTDAGVTWGAEQLISTSSEQMSNPQILADNGGRVWVGWVANAGSSNGDALYIARSTNYGASTSWSAATALTAVTPRSSIGDFEIGTDGGGSNVYVAYIRSSDISNPGTNPPTIGFRRSTNGGTSYSAATTFAATFPSDVSMAARGSFVHVSWVESFNKSVRARRSTDNGATFQATTTVETTAIAHEYVGELDSDCDTSGNAYVAYSKVARPTTALGTKTDVRASCLRTNTSSWTTPQDLSNADVFPDFFPVEACGQFERGRFTLTRPKISVSGSVASVVWMTLPEPNGSYSRAQMSFTKNFASTWSTPLDLNGSCATQTRAGYPAVFATPTRSGCVWDERRHWTDPTVTPVPPFNGHGAPESFFVSVST